MAGVVWLKPAGGEGRSFLLKEGKIDVQFVCKIFGLDAKEDMEIGDLTLEAGSDPVVYDAEAVGGGRNKKTAVVVRNVLQPVAPGVRYVFVKPKGAKVVIDQGLPVNVMAAEEQLRKQTGWLYNKLSFLDHSGTSMTSEDLQKYLEERVAEINHVEVTVTVSPQDRGFSSFSQAEGLDYLNFSSSYKVDEAKDEFAPKIFEKQDEKVGAKLEGFEEWTVAQLIDHFVNDVKLRTLVFKDFELEGYELTRRELISPVLILAALLNPKLVELRAEAQVHGTLGHGPIDYTAHIEKIQMLLAEAKRFDLGSHRGLLYAEMAASRETLARTIEPSTLKRKFEELEEVLEGVSTTGVLTDASTWKFTRYRNEDGTPRLLESEELKVGLSTSAPDKELRAEIMRIVGVLVAAFEKHADEYERIIQDRMSKRRKVGEKQTGDGDHL